jgi:hypothetical protein
MQSGRHPVLDVAEHRRHLRHPHPRVHPIEGRRALEQRMRCVKPLAGGFGLAGEGDDLGQKYQPVRLVGGACRPCADGGGGGGGTLSIGASRVSDT